MTKLYRVRKAGEIAGAWAEAGATLSLTDAQAKYLAPPYGRQVDPVEKTDVPRGRPARKQASERPSED